MHPPDVLDFAPERVVDPVRRRPLLARLGVALGDGLLSLLLNAAVVGWLAQVGWPLRSAEAPAAVSVEIVDHIPGQDTSKGGAGSASATSASSAGQGQEAKPSSPQAVEANRSVARATPPAEKPPESQPPPPETPPSAPEPKTPPTPPATEASSSEPSSSPVAAETPPSSPAVPPPPEHPDNTAEPHLVEAPKPPAPNPAPNPDLTADATPEPTKPPVPEPSEPPPTRPDILSSRNATDTVAPAAAPPESPPEPTAEQKRQAESTAKLAAVLPFSAMGAADPFGGRFASQGQTASQNYRGAVYGNFAKGNDLVEEARAKHMRGQAVIAFSVDDKGNLDHLAVAVSSGNPALDQTALELIRRAAPFPPPPPGAQRSFSPAIGFGLDE